MLRRSTFVFCLILAMAMSTELHAKNSVVGVKSLPEKPASVQPAKASIPSGKISVSKTEAPPPAPLSNQIKDEVKAEVKAEKKEEKKEEKKGIQAGYKKGFYIQSADEKYKLVIGGYTQFDFDFDRVEGENKFGFRIRRARLSFSGNIATKKLTYKLQVDFVKFKTELLLDAYMNYRILGDSLEVRYGQQTVPWIRQNIISSSNLEFLDRSVATTEFTNVQDTDSDGDGLPDKQTRNGRDIGIMLHGREVNKKLEYQAGFFNGSGTNTTNFNNSFLYTGRVVYNFLGDAGYEEGDYDFTQSPAFYFGASGNFNTRDLTEDKITMLGSETGLKYKGFAAQGEFFFRHNNPNDATLTSKNDYGYYAQAGYFAIPKRLEFAVRASQIFFEGLQNDKAEFQIGVNGFVYGKHVKLQSDYSVLPNNTKEGVETSQRWRLRLQTKF